MLQLSFLQFQSNEKFDLLFDTHGFDVFDTVNRAKLVTDYFKDQKTPHKVISFTIYKKLPQ